MVMKVAGIDIGELTTKVVILEEGNILYHGIAITADKAEIAARKAIEIALQHTNLAMLDLSYVLATGMTRNGVSFANDTKTIITCLAKGVRRLFPDVRTVIDVGAESAAVFNIDGAGRVDSFTLNDKCGAGSGVFLESMAKMLEMSIEDMVDEALRADKAVTISNTCTIFAEQEVLSYTFAVPPVPMAEIVAGIHESLASRIFGLAKRVRIVPEVVLCGGVAKNRAFVKSLNKRVESELLVPEEPQIISALGAALLAAESATVIKGN